MRYATLIMSILLLGATGPVLAAATTTTTVSVHLTVQTHAGDAANLDPGQTAPLAGTAECTLEVPEGSDGGTLLETAVEDACILEWDYVESSGGKFVTSIDGLRADGFTCILWEVGFCDWWQHHVNGNEATYGIDDYSAQDDDTVLWEYQNTPP